MHTDVPASRPQGAPRVDAQLKASGALKYTADLAVPGLVFAAVARSSAAHARIRSIDLTDALEVEGVIGAFTADDLSRRLYGRSLVDAPILAADKVRYVGERVAAVVATTRASAELAASLIVVDYEDLAAVVTAQEALASEAVLVHDEAWAYEGAAATPQTPGNVIFHKVDGSVTDLESALEASAFSVDRTYTTVSGHHGYLEPQACVAHYQSPEHIQVWLTNKAPYRIREMLAGCLGIDPAHIDVQATTLGGDFGGKGSVQDAPLCVELSRLTGRPVKMVLRYSEDLTSTNPRHPAEVRVRIGCDQEGRITALGMQAVTNAGAYGGFTPNVAGPHGAVEVSSYAVPVRFTELTRVYTNTVPRGNMRAPGAPQGIFAVESAMDELAFEAGLDPVELRRRNLRRKGDFHAHDSWLEHRGVETLEAALSAVQSVDPPEGWVHGSGVAVYSRSTPHKVDTSLRLIPGPDQTLRVQTPLVETGTGSHTVLARLLSQRLGLPFESISVEPVPTSSLPSDAGAGGGRVTAAVAGVVDAAARAWEERADDAPILVRTRESIGSPVGSYTVQVVQVAVEPDTGKVQVLEVLTAVDVASVVNPLAHQMQIDGGTVMGLGFALMEDLDESDGQVWAAGLGDFKLPSVRDVPVLRTVLVPGAVGLGVANIKNIGESTTPPVAAAVANAVFAATGCRVRDLPITPEKVLRQLVESL